MKLVSFSIFEQVDAWKFEHGFSNRLINVANGDSDFQEYFSTKLYLLNQTHGLEIVEVLEEFEIRDADAWIVKVLEKTTACFGIKTADCVPILINSNAYRAAVHCGWRGAVNGLLPKVINRMIDLGVRVESMEFALGPAASIKSYEVGDDVLSRVQEALKVISVEDFSQVISRRNGRFCVGIRELLKEQIQSFGVRKELIATSNKCTILDNNYFSYRREKNESGRQLSFISN